MDLNIKVITTSDVALYEQISSQIKDLIINGMLQEGDPLPSVRALAQGLGVSAITTRRAYTDLEQEGYVFTAPAKGTFVSRRYVERLRELGLIKLNDLLESLTYLALSMQVSEEDLMELVKEHYEDASANPDYKTQLSKLRRNRGRLFSQLLQ